MSQFFYATLYAYIYVCIQEIKNLSKNKFRRSIWELFQHNRSSSHTNKNVTQFSNDKVPLKENIHALTFINYYRSHFLLGLLSAAAYLHCSLQIIILFREAKLLFRKNKKKFMFNDLQKYLV